jgi:hypothetical protein
LDAVSYNNPEMRRAFIAGARVAVDAAILDLSPPVANELEQWLSDLECWTDGDPPLAPHQWATGDESQG